MLSLLWSALNLVLLLSIFYILYRAAKLVKQHLGPGAMLFFLLALFVIGGRRSESTAGTSKNLLAHSTREAGVNASSTREIPLGGGNTLSLLAEYRTSNGPIEPLGLYATASGMVLGHDWEPIGGLLHQAGPQVHYSVVMHHYWLLLGIRTFGQLEQFTGTMPVPGGS